MAFEKRNKKILYFLLSLVKVKEKNERSRTMPQTTSNRNVHEEIAHANSDYPVGVYYVEPGKMYMGYVRWHWHEEIEINLVKSGSAEFTIGDEKVVVKEGQAILLNCNVFHSIKSCGNDDCVLLSLVFHPNILFKIHTSTLATGYLNPITNDSKHRYLIFDRKDMWGRGALAYLSDIFDANFAQEFGYELTTKAYLCQLWVHLLKKFKTGSVVSTRQDNVPPVLSPDEARIKDAIVYIQQHYTESVTLDDIAGSIHVSKSECCRCFKRAVKLTPFEYLMRYRILQAADKILQNDRDTGSISELACSVGFNNTSYFNKLFKKYFNCTPTEYRKMSKTEHRDKLSHFGLSLTHI